MTRPLFFNAGTPVFYVSGVISCILGRDAVKSGGHAIISVGICCNCYAVKTSCASSVGKYLSLDELA